MAFRLVERAARRALAAGEKVPNLLAGQVAARPTGENTLGASRAIALVTFDLASRPRRRGTVRCPTDPPAALGCPATADAALDSSSEARIDLCEIHGGWDRMGLYVDSAAALSQRAMREGGHLHD